MIKKIIIDMKGGLGNQIFQYAFAKSLAYDLNLKVYVIFRRDKIYDRYLLLSRIFDDIVEPSVWIIFLIKFSRLLNRISCKLSQKFLLAFNYRLVKEDSLSKTVHDITFFKEIESAPSELPYNFVLEGYWQSHKYFQHRWQDVLKNLKWEVDLNYKFKQAVEMIESVDHSISLGLRFYEESQDPLAHLSDGKLKSVHSINNLIHLFRINYPNCQFFVSTTKRNDFIKQLDLPDNTMFLIEEEGFKDPINALYLISKCRHHVVTASTFYWWGAYLSKASHDQQEIFIADNFIDPNSLIKDWQIF